MVATATRHETRSTWTLRGLIGLARWSVLCLLFVVAAAILVCVAAATAHPSSPLPAPPPRAY